ncbi:MAG: ParB N-terminal domain-containing protein [Bradyrhizobium sp.]|jgi:ParB family transcriptional regulator, chromosome partitioning protein|uniref:Chromosome partitioning protein ParB n=4 Tax=Hyphomicrobiales TaxID=356 RepID=A0A1C2DCW7_9HYPH|nr:MULTISPECIES: ParB/RepB/Spo0J family partition protein [Alphaproteobacteria]MBN8942725.1 ParB N-terminal domain-containing protein [Hyphomicrobiales bacterium]MCP4619641.1 ParB N-terminal domain-containing protein [Bradyrhizobium sp.]MBN9232985.1 ParB N-terminal domain-containing protein [Mesorhizobium sp.]MBR1134193.1 ParB N-terminal domain-containing protein [Bradyrhizobium denitrificans]MBX9992053.1 ParB N-terminal domain-containing protein [Phreatobacter oligotrophus]
MTTNANTAPVIDNGATVFIPLNKLKKHPKNARKTPHSEASIEAKAASIAAKGILQNLVVEPERDAEGEPTGFYLVTIGEGRRLAQLLRVKRKEIKKTEPIRCVIDTVNDPAEISLDENVSREDLSPADQFERFRELADNRGWGAEEIAARFGVTAHVVKQRLRLGAVSPKLMQVYRDGDLTLDQLMAFAITEDHARQEQVYENLSHNREPWIIRRDLTKTNVAATDRRAIFVGAQAYAEAGGNIIRDLFTEDRGGFYEDAALLDRLVIDKLERIASQVQEAEGWKWVSVHIDYPHAHGLRRTYPQPVQLSEDDAAAYDGAQKEYDRLSSEYESAEELPDDVDQKFGELEAEIERIDALRHVYDAQEIARSGVFVVLSHDGETRIERGFIRAEDEKPEEVDTSETVNDGVRVSGDGEIIEDSGHDEGGNLGSDLEPEDEEAEEDGKPLSDLLIRDLTAHRTLGLRLALGEQPDMALLAVTHALAAQTFYRGVDATCLEIRPTSAHLGGHADGIEDTAAGKALADRHAAWAADMPRDVAELWGFIASLDHASVMALFAHCAALTVNAVKQPWERKPCAHETADSLATAVALDMTAHWTPTVRTYLGRVTKAHILAAVREAVSNEAADRIAAMKKQPMAEAAEQLLAATGWLPPLMRTVQPAWLTDEQPDAPRADAEDAHEASEPEAFAVAAE